MKFFYHWQDQSGILHFTKNRDEADKALQNGYQIFLVMRDERKAE